MTKPIGIAVSGAGGRLGQAILQAIAADPNLACVSRIGRGGARDGQDQPQDLETALTAADVVIDVSTPSAVADMARQCAAAGRPLVTGVTGLSVEQQAIIEEAAGRVAVLQSGNFSLGVNLLLALVRQAARALGPAYDIEIFEAHHRRKVDAPSGTALMLGRAAAEGRGVSLDEVASGLDGSRAGLREEGAIGFAVSRGGGIVGEHAVSFAGEREILTLAHSARDRSLFADGAVAAARWIIGRPPGFYEMADVLQLQADGEAR